MNYLRKPKFASERNERKIVFFSSWINLMDFQAMKVCETLGYVMYVYIYACV